MTDRPASPDMLPWTCPVCSNGKSACTCKPAEKPRVWTLRECALIINNLNDAQQEIFKHDAVKVIEYEAYEELEAIAKGIGVANRKLHKELDAALKEVERLNAELSGASATIKYEQSRARAWQERALKAEQEVK